VPRLRTSNRCLEFAGRLSAYKVPKRIVIMDEKDVPMMSSGKLDLRALKER